MFHERLIVTHCPRFQSKSWMLRELASKGKQQFVADLAVELQLSHPMELEQQ